MKPKDNLEKLIKEMSMPASKTADERNIEDAMTAFDRAQVKRGSYKMIAAAAAVVLVLVMAGVLVIQQRQIDELKQQPKIEIVMSPIDMMRLISLNRAYRDGGIEAVEEQFDRAFKQLGPRPANLTIDELLEEFENEEDDIERTRI
ncbi:hypothetical protein ACFL3G_11430 [Planctomycetota bacterium]